MEFELLAYLAGAEQPQKLTNIAQALQLHDNEQYKALVDALVSLIARGLVLEQIDHSTDHYYRYELCRQT